MFPKPVPDERLEKMKEAEAKRLAQYEERGYDPGSAAHVVSKAAQRANQERFLEVFSRCLSPKLACKQAEVSSTTYQKWRSTDVWFAEQLNQVMEDWREELLSAAVTRAIGYTTVDDDGNLTTDASGKVVYHGGSDQLARALLQLGGDESKRREPVHITINLDAAGYNEELAPKALDAEYKTMD
ncbi:MAG: hypothetical protein AAF756_15170 [Pseudomonadota bacterium]